MKLFCKGFIRNSERTLSLLEPTVHVFLEKECESLYADYNLNVDICDSVYSNEDLFSTTHL